MRKNAPKQTFYRGRPYKKESDGCGIVSLENKVLRRGKAERKAGRDLPDVLANNYFKDVYHAIAELVANAVDARATEVRISYDIQKQTLSIIDNGVGMDEDDVKAFYWLGDSPKKRTIKVNGRTLDDLTLLFTLPPDAAIEVREGTGKKARKRETVVEEFLKEPGTMGKWGIGSIAVKALAGSYSLKTRHKGHLIVAEETFSGGDGANTNIPYTVRMSEEKKRGTELYLRDLHLGWHGKTFDVARLEHRLAREMPLRRVKILVNNRPLTPTPIRNATPFRFDENVRGVGQVHGMIWLARTNLPSEDRGISIRVHGRAIGDNRVIDTKRYSRSDIADKLFGEVNADGLDSLIGIDRTRFNRDHPAFQAVETLVGRVLGAAKRTYLHLQTEVKEEKLENYVEEARGIVERWLTKKSHDMLGEGKRITTVVCDAARAGAFGMYDAKRGTLYLNPDTVSAAMLPKRGRATGLALAFYTQSLYAITMTLSDATLGKPVDYARFDGLLLEVGKAAMVRDAHTPVDDGAGSRARKARKEELVNEYRMYEPDEIRELAGWGVALCHRMTDAGLLPVEVIDEKERVHGKHILSLEKRLDGYIPAYELLRRKFEGLSASDLQAREKRVMGRLNSHKDDDSLPSYVHDISSTDAPFYIIHQTRQRDFNAFLDTLDFGARAGGGKKTEERKAYAMKKIGDDTVLFYACSLGDIRDRDKARDVALRANDFIRQVHAENQLHSRRFAYVLPAEGGEPAYLFGGILFSGNSILETLTEMFGKEKYANGEVERPAMRTVHEELERQRGISLPLTIRKELDRHYATLLGQLFS